MSSGWFAVLAVIATCLVFFAPIAYELWVPERWKSRWEPRDVIWDEQDERMRLADGQWARVEINRE